MSRSHIRLVDEAREAIENVVSDTSVGWETTVRSLDELESIVVMAREAIEEEHKSD